jgi:hypothetical protein
MIMCSAKEIYLYKMKPKALNSEKLAKVPQEDLLSLVAFKLKGRVLFPEKVERLKQQLKHVQFVKR